MLERSTLHEWSFSASAEWVIAVVLALALAMTAVFVAVA